MRHFELIISYFAGLGSLGLSKLPLIVGEVTPFDCADALFTL